MTKHFDFELPGGPSASRAARHALLSRNGEIPAHARGDVLLLLSELVTNAVQHGCRDEADRLNVSVAESPEVVHVEVRDPGRRAASQHRVEPDAGGWGLLLVKTLADRWGVGHEDGSTVVWFDYRLAGR